MTIPKKPMSGGQGGVKPLSSSGGGAMAQLRASRQNASAAASSGTPVEERLVAMPGFPAGVAAPALLKDFLEKLAPPLALPRLSRSILNAFGTVDLTSERVAEILRQNPYYEYQFMQVILSRSKREDPPSLDAAVVLLGMQNTRNLLVALQVLRTVKGGPPQWGADGKLQLEPDKILKYALSAENQLAKYHKTYSDTGFSAGLVFDLLAMIAETLDLDGTTAKKIPEYLEEVFKHGIKTAVVAAEVAKAVPDFAAKRYLLSASLVHDVGRLAMALLDPAYFAHVETATGAGFGRLLSARTEEARFGLHHARMGSLVLTRVGLFKAFETAILFHHEPYLLKTRSKTLYQLAAIVSLSANIAADLKKPNSVDDPVIPQWKGPELAEFKIEPRALIDNLARVTGP